MKSNGFDSASSPARSLRLLGMLAGAALLAQSAWAVPSFSRRYEEPCSTCHTMWGALTGAGTTFKLSGYRAISGKDLTPTTPDTKIAKGVTVPSSLPLSFVTGVGVESRSETRQVPALGLSATSKSTSLALEDASIFMTSPLGEHLSAFVEFPMYETRAWEFTPTGNYEARYNNSPGRQIKFSTESPGFEVAKFFWNNPVEGLPRDSFNFLAGITHLPLAYSPGKVRLSVNQYLIYERTPLSLLSPRKVDDVVGGDPNDSLFRYSEPQVIAETFGMLTFGKPVTDVAKRDTFWAEYHLGVTNGTNAKAANASTNGVYGRWVMRYYNQSLGFNGYHSGDSYSDTLRTSASIAGNASGIMSGKQDSNAVNRAGIDATLSLVPWGVPLTLENQFMENSDSNPTGFGRSFKWKGGFNQLNWLISKKSIAYLRYDYLKGDPFDDTGALVNSVNGITRSTPKEHDYVLGFQHLIDENIKFVGEYRNHVYEDNASGALIPTLGVATNPAKLTDNGLTLRLMFGF